MEQRQIGRYRVLEEIASGTQGAVYRAFETDIGRIVALKVLHQRMGDDSDYLERFHREATLTASVDHPNVVQIFEVGQDDDQHFIALEYLPVDLHRLIETGALEIEVAAGIAIGIADGMGAVHALGITHRDLKPHNVLITSEGTPKVTDFGIARSENLVANTATGTIMGTPHYMSPEQAQSKVADARSDVYALGCILYQMLTGDLPFDSDSLYSVLRMQVEEQHRPIPTVREQVPGPLSSVVDRAMEKDPNQRYSDGAAMAQAIRQAMPGISTVAIQGTIVNQVRQVDQPDPPASGTLTPPPSPPVDEPPVRLPRPEPVPPRRPTIIFRIVTALIGLAVIGVATVGAIDYFDLIGKDPTTAVTPPDGNAPGDSELVAGFGQGDTPTGLVHWWPAEGSAEDVVGNSDGSMRNGATFADGFIGQAFSFDGTGDYVHIPDSPELDAESMTLSAWVKLDRHIAGQYNFASRFFLVPGSEQLGDMSWELGVHNSGLNAFVSSGCGAIDRVLAPPKHLTTGVWQHVAFVADGVGNMASLYLDGEPLWVTDIEGFCGTSDTVLQIGDGRPGLGIDGLIDEFAMFDRALSDAEIKDLFVAGTAGLPVLPDVVVAELPEPIPGPLGIVHIWSAEGNAADTVGGTSGAMARGASYGDGIVGQAFHFAGLGDALVFEEGQGPQLTNKFTISAWLKFDSERFETEQTVFDSSQILLRKNAADAFGGNKISVEIKPGDGSIYEPTQAMTMLGNEVEPPAQSWTSVEPDIWYHLAASWDGRSLKVFVDGAGEGSVERQRIGFNLRPVRGRIGAREPGNSYAAGFAGSIDEFSFYERALSASEIETVFEAGSAGIPLETGGTELVTESTPGSVVVTSESEPVPAPPGLVHWWPADGSTDDVVGDNHGFIQGDTSYSDGKAGQAFNFDGNADGVTIRLGADPNISDAMTIGAWVKITGTSNYNNNYQEIYNNNQFFLRKAGSGEDNKFQLSVQNSNGGISVASSATAPLLNNWYHVAGSWSENSIKLYVNGVLEGNSQSSIAISPDTPFQGRIGISERLNPDANPFAGLIDELMIFDRELDAAEIFAIFEAGTAGVIQPTGISFVPDVLVTSTADSVDANPGDGICDDGAGRCTLRAAVMESNAFTGADTITIPAGTYELTVSGLADDNSGSGDLDINGKLTIRGAGSNDTIIDGGARERIFHILTNRVVDISGLTIRNGLASIGGGIYVSSGTVTLDEVVIADNVAVVTGRAFPGRGGGIYNEALLDIRNSTVVGNTAAIGGGGIFHPGGSLIISNSTISDNVAGWAAGLSTSAPTTVTESVITRNRALEGAGGGVGAGSTLTLVSSEVSHNTADFVGGGIHNSGLLELTRSTIHENIAADGGGIRNDTAGTVIVINSTIRGNSVSGGSGGGVDNDGLLTITNGTITDNSSANGGGIFNGGTVDLVNTIVAINKFGDDCSPDGFTSLGHNLDSDGTCSLTDPTDLPNTDPLLGPVEDNGGPTQTYALVEGSPAIDAGNDSAAPDTDQRGVTRPQGAASDIGAVEVVPEFDGLIHMWTGDGNARDAVGSNDGSLMNGAGYAPGLILQAFEFDGVDDQIEVLNSHSATTFTIEAWVYLEPPSTNWVTIYTSASQGFLLSNRKLVWFEHGDILLRNSVVSTGKWHHLAITYDEITLVAYIDGQVDAVQAYAGVSLPSGVRIGIGAHEGNGTDPLKGLIDGLKIYDRALTEDEIQSTYEAYKPT